MLKCVPICQVNIVQYLHLIMAKDVGFTQRKREFNPARNEDSIEVPVRDNKDVAGTYAFFEIFPMDFADLHMHHDC